VSFSGQLGVQWLQPLGGAQQQARRVPAASHVEGDLRPHPLHLGLAELIEGSGFGAREQCLGRGEIPRLALRPGRRKSPEGSSCRVRGERHRAFQEGGCGGDTAAPLGAAGTLDQLAGHRLVRSTGRMRPMPCPSIGIGAGIGGSRQGAMDDLAISGLRRAVDR